MTSSRPDPSTFSRRLTRAVTTPLLNGLVYPLSRLTPRRSDIWLFGHQDGAFAGNSKFLFLWVHANQPEIRAVWVTRNPKVAEVLQKHGLPVRRRGTLGAAWLSLRAGAYFYCHGPDDVSVPLSGGALLVNLWHGVGLKSLRLGNPNRAKIFHERPWLARLKNLGTQLKPDVLVTTSEFMQQHFSSQFDLPREQCPILGYPRVDGIYDAEVSATLRRIPGNDPKALWSDGVAEVYAYVPTYRDTRGGFFEDAIPDVGRLEAALEKRNAILYVKWHRHTRGKALPETSRVREWPDAVDLDASLPHLTGLITDYSSVHYDYIFHTDRGSILYMFDEVEYTASDRLLLYPIDDNTAGWKVRTFDQLLQLIESGEALKPHPDVAAIRRKFWGGRAEFSSERIVRHVRQVLGKRSRRLSTTIANPSTSSQDRESASAP